jgi:hypothetical protein
MPASDGAREAQGGAARSPRTVALRPFALAERVGDRLRWTCVTVLVVGIAGAAGPRTARAGAHTGGHGHDRSAIAQAERPSVACGMSAGPGADEPGDVAALSRALQRLAESDVASDHALLAERLTRGVPPGPLAAALDAIGRNPDPVYRAVVQREVSHRRVEVRGRALLALAALGSAEDAVARAADDHDRRVRRVALFLAQHHSTPVIAAVIAELLRRDPELAAEAGA